MHLVFDIGGTNTRIAISNDSKTLLKTHKFKTPRNAEEGVAEMARASRELLEGAKLTMAGGGIRGPLSHEKSSVVSDDVLVGWVGAPIKLSLEKVLGVPVYLENDTAVAALGEAHFGAGRGHDIVAYHTISTGVGGARVVHGRIDVSSVGFEPGKQIVDIDYTKLGGETDTLEELISGTALEKRRGVKPYEISQADPVWDELAKYLATGLRNTVAYWSPDVIVLGGSMMVGDPRIPLNPVRLHMNALLGGSMPCPPIFDAKFRDDGGLYGSLVLLSQKARSKRR